MNELIIITKIKKTILYFNNILDNFPKKEVILKSNIEKTLYNILENIYRANYIDKRIEFLYKTLVQIKMIDFYLKILLEKKIINYKKFIIICNYFNEITKMLYGMINNEKKKYKI